MTVTTDPTSDDPFAVALDAEGLRRSSVRGTVVTAGSQAIRMVLQIGSQVVLARLLFPSDFGLLAMALPIISFIQVFNDLGLGQAIIQRETLEQDRVSALFWVNILLSFGLAVIVALLAPVAGWLYGEPRVVGLMLALALLIPVGALGIHPNALLARRMRFNLIAYNEVIASFLGIFVTVAAAWAGWSYWSLVAGQLVNLLVANVLGWIACGWRPSPPKFVASAWADLKFGGNLTGANLATFITTSADNVIIGTVLGRDALGLYDRSYRLVVQPLGQLLMPISRVSVPLLSRLRDRPDAYRDSYLDLIRAVVLLKTPGVLVCIVFAAPFIHVFLGPRWDAAAPVFGWICVGGLATGIYDSAVWLFVSQARTATMRRYMTVAAVLNLLSFIVGAWWGISGVAAGGAVVFTLVTTPLLLAGASSDGPVSGRDLLRCLVPALAQTVIVYALLHLVSTHVAVTSLLDLVGVTILSYALFLVTALFTSQRRLLSMIVQNGLQFARIKA